MIHNNRSRQETTCASGPDQTSREAAPKTHQTEPQPAAGSAKPLSLGFLTLLLRAVELTGVAVLGVAIYIVYVQRGQASFSLQYLVSIGLALLLFSLTADRIGAYSRDVVLDRRPGSGRALAAWAIAFALLLTLAFALKISDFYSRVWALSWFLSTIALLILGRIVFGAWTTRIAAQGRFASRTVIVGTGPLATRLGAHLESYDRLRTQILGLVSENGSIAPDRNSLRWPFLGGLDALNALIQTGRVDQVIIALPWTDAARLREVVERLTVSPVAIRLAPDLVVFDYIGRSFIDVAGLPMLHLFDRPISGWSRVAKAVEDYALATLLLILLSPLLLILALAIKLDSPGPVLFKQRRLGFNSMPIEIWKFRTMRADLAEPNGRIVQAKKSDPRVTRVGRYLRRSSLDELPQLINVLRGNMSIVGPRPHPPGIRAEGRLFEEAVERYAARHRVKPGITGWAQINGWRGETDTVEKLRKRVEYDLYYIDNWSIGLDLFIIARSFIIIFKGTNAY